MALVISGRRIDIFHVVEEECDVEKSHHLEFADRESVAHETMSFRTEPIIRSGTSFLENRILIPEQPENRDLVLHALCGHEEICTEACRLVIDSPLEQVLEPLVARPAITHESEVEHDILFTPIAVWVPTGEEFDTSFVLLEFPHEPVQFSILAGEIHWFGVHDYTFGLYNNDLSVSVANLCAAYRSGLPQQEIALYIERASICCGKYVLKEQNH